MSLVAIPLVSEPTASVGKDDRGFNSNRSVIASVTGTTSNSRQHHCDLVKDGRQEGRQDRQQDEKAKRRGISLQRRHIAHTPKSPASCTIEMITIMPMSKNTTL